MIDYKKQGRTNRRHGAEFEQKTRKDLEEDGWIVDKFTNNIDLEKSQFVQAKSNRFNSRSCGFPDFIAFIKIGNNNQPPRYKVIFVECKINGKLSRTEKLKMEWLNEEGFVCWVASKDGTSVEYKIPGKVRRTKIRN